MKVLGIRFCSVSGEAAELAEFFGRLGLDRSEVGDSEAATNGVPGETEFLGALFSASGSLPCPANRPALRTRRPTWGAS